MLVGEFRELYKGRLCITNESGIHVFIDGNSPFVLFDNWFVQSIDYKLHIMVLKIGLDKKEDNDGWSNLE
ncbi:MAG: hypothetical protein IJM25_11780 [Eubacterium sp.]|nr:hypothetical protein [Eubacterium sp.]